MDKSWTGGQIQATTVGIVGTPRRPLCNRHVYKVHSEQTLHTHTHSHAHTRTHNHNHTHTHTHTHAHTTTHTHTHTTTHTHLQAHLCIIAAHAITDHCPQRLPHRFLLHYTEAPVQLAVLLKVINVPVGAHCHTPVMNTCASFAEWCHSVCPHHHTGYNCWGGRYFGGGGIKETRV